MATDDPEAEQWLEHEGTSLLKEPLKASMYDMPGPGYSTKGSIPASPFPIFGIILLIILIGVIYVLFFSNSPFNLQKMSISKTSIPLGNVTPSIFLSGNQSGVISFKAGSVHSTHVVSGPAPGKPAIIPFSVKDANVTFVVIRHSTVELDVNSSFDAIYVLNGTLLLNVTGNNDRIITYNASLGTSANSAYAFPVTGKSDDVISLSNSFINIST